MRSWFERTGSPALVGFIVAILLLIAPAVMFAQGGEPKYFAIRGARVVPVSGPAMADATIVVARGIIVAVAKDATIPADAWVIEARSDRLSRIADALTDVGFPARPAPAAEGAARRTGEGARGPEDRPNSTPWRNAADEVSLSDKRIETWRNAGFTTVVSSQGRFFPGHAVLDLAGERAGDLVVKSPVAIPVSIKPLGGFGSGFPDSLMGVLGFEHQVWLDTDWLTKAGEAYEKNPKGIARPRYDRASAALAEALEDHALILVSGNSTLDMRRALDLTDRWKVNVAIYGGQSGYEIADEIAAKKFRC
jgi:hypothetical protein